MSTAERPHARRHAQGAQACPGLGGQPHLSLHGEGPLRAFFSTTQDPKTRLPLPLRHPGRHTHRPPGMPGCPGRDNTHAVARPCSAICDDHIFSWHAVTSAREAEVSAGGPTACSLPGGTSSGHIHDQTRCAASPALTCEKPSIITSITTQRIPTDAHLLAFHEMSCPEGARPPWCAPQGGGR